MFPAPLILMFIPITIGFLVIICDKDFWDWERPDKYKH